jgi:hypothetical protein
VWVFAKELLQHELSDFIEKDMGVAVILVLNKRLVKVGIIYSAQMSRTKNSVY